MASVPGSQITLSLFTRPLLSVFSHNSDCHTVTLVAVITVNIGAATLVRYYQCEQWIRKTAHVCVCVPERARVGVWVRVCVSCGAFYVSG
uniref:Uncharacterized protein n=1 Tax=Anguilla anguilla TaxID=7936 RepID=A0A0E9R3M9_ANGAN